VSEYCAIYRVTIYLPPPIDKNWFNVTPQDVAESPSIGGLGASETVTTPFLRLTSYKFICNKITCSFVLTVVSLEDLF
jgi:hypothetical protein